MEKVYFFLVVVRIMWIIIWNNVEFSFGYVEFEFLESCLIDMLIGVERSGLEVIVGELYGWWDCVEWG